MADDRDPQINPPVFFVSAGLILTLAGLGVAFGADAEPVLTHALDWITDTFGWFYLLSVAGFLVFVLYLGMSRHGHIRLGPDNSEPEYGHLSWFAMLFSAGMGIGLLFFGVAEPVMHFVEPPEGAGGTVDAAREAMKLTFFHYGIHAWAIYIVVGLSLAYFAFRHDLPLTIRSALYPLLGKRIHGRIGHAVDIFAVLGTMFGVATSLGVGVMQVNAGLAHLFGIPDNTTMQIVLIAGITGLATISVVMGLDGGIKRLSELNLLFALGLLLFVMVVGPTEFILQTFVENTGTYLSDLADLTFQLYAYEPNDWVGGWTLFYWGWWIAWSPFVGMFIARISRGRTIREFVMGVLFVPVGFTFLWLTVFGDTALSIELSGNGGAISAAARDNMPTAMFVMLEELPLSSISAGLSTALVITFFVTSSDSGSLVIDMITSGGSAEPPVWQRVFWAVSEGVVAAALLLAGGLVALQSAAIGSALPFTVVIIAICFSLLKGLRMEAAAKRVTRSTPPRVPISGASATWQTRLRNIVRHYSRDAVARFLADTAQPALDAVAKEVRASGMTADVTHTDGRVRLDVRHGEQDDFVYEIRTRGYRTPSFAFPEMPSGGGTSRLHYRAEVYLQTGPEHYDVMGYSKDQVIADILSQYDKHMHVLHLAV
ncbi:choline/glycine/proline betaine transport protein [Rhodothalassium salexigens DSM 2132]|uniref:Choline/glycine/proline betaine transport protein n=1 Tax=Rhodothalassium salexigens DSM 2132 TaxID=1188247 RepID=A0A4R2PGS6_RHOSA|nr:choline BCCT transporter BetT [Rhodothalassium salexigens]MBB4211641.1 choline/glycine/proline betaine transport protein [Rhodothalassium salexigens DSM 2132]MBK1639105.1 choline transporter [Rhodothalassium salexigens DSM 2132]TCP34427.1 choline/glycine/proline betaine transport protein [Rhodothalassium salexigens DSM 2132]